MQEAPRRSAEITRIPLDPQARLRAALRMLETRLDQQRACIAAWRAELSSLCSIGRKLQESSQACERSVDGLPGCLDEARQATAALHRNADRLVEAADVG